MEVLCRSAWQQDAIGRTAGRAFASAEPITAAVFLAAICAKSLNLFTPRRRTPVPGWACGYRAALCRSTAERFGCEAVRMGAPGVPYFPSSYPGNMKLAV